MLGALPTSMSVSGGPASSEASQKLSDFTTGGQSAGNRGFQNNVAFPGASVNADQGINPPIFGAFKHLTTWAAVIGVAVLAWLAWRRR